VAEEPLYQHQDTPPHIPGEPLGMYTYHVLHNPCMSWRTVGKATLDLLSWLFQRSGFVPTLYIVGLYGEAGSNAVWRAREARSKVIELALFGPNVLPTLGTSLSSRGLDPLYWLFFCLLPLPFPTPIPYL